MTKGYAMNTKDTLSDRSPSIGNEYNVKISFYSNAKDSEPKMSLALAGNYRINLLRLAIGITAAVLSVATAVAAVKIKNRKSSEF